MKKVLKWIGIILCILFIGGFISVKILSEDFPKGETGPKAEQLANKVLNAINDSALDSIDWLTWEFIGGHHYVWHQPTNTARITWGDQVVILQLDNQSGRAWSDGKEMAGEQKAKLIQTAWSYWCNDSFWLLAPNKIKDPGTMRSLVNVSKEYPNHQGLLVQYNSGGVTPGDAYLWLIDDSGIPSGYKMWVSILPIKGLYTSWEGWTDLHNGAKVATRHNAGIAEFGMDAIQSADTWQEFNLDTDPLVGL